MSDDTKAAPSLADDLAQRMADHDCGCGSVEGVVLTPCSHRENYRSIADVALAHPTILAALRAVEAVRALHTPYINTGGPWRIFGRDHVKGDPLWCNFCGSPVSWPCATLRTMGVTYEGYRDGVEAVQALLKGMK